MGLNLSKIVTKMPSVRWHMADLLGKTLYSRAFGSFGSGTVLVRPLRMVGVENIYLGDQIAIYEDAWIASEAGGILRIGSGTYVGHRSHIHALSNVTIGKDCVFADNVMVNSGEHPLDSLHDVQPGGDIMIGDRVFLGQNVSVLGGVTIGDGAVIGAGAVVTRDIPANAVAVGIPATVILVRSGEKQDA